jgi:starvation-inducible DNA-binding protein
MKTNIGISENNRQNVALELSKILANEYVLHTKTKQQAGQIAETIDEVAERIRTLGHLVPATLKAFLELSHLTEYVPTKNDSQTFINELLSAHETIIAHLRSNINLFANDYEDLGTSDFITGLMQEHEKTAWILRAHLKK